MFQQVTDSQFTKINVSDHVELTTEGPKSTEFENTFTRNTLMLEVCQLIQIGS